MLWRRGNIALQSFSRNACILYNWTCLGFSKMRKILPGSESKVIEQSLTGSIPTNCIDIDENQTPGLHHGIWSRYKRWWQYLHSSSHLSHNQHRGLHYVPIGVLAPLDPWLRQYSSTRCGLVSYPGEPVVGLLQWMTIS